MAKCFFTGIEQPVEEMFILDTTATRKAIRNLHRQAAAVEQILEQLNVKDEAEVYNPAMKTSSKLRFFRLVSPTVAQALSAACPEVELFMPWNAFKLRRREHFAMRKAAVERGSHAEPTEESVDNTGGVS